MKVTERRGTDETLSRANERIAEILESITDAFSAWDRNFRYVYVNARAAELLGIPRDHLIGRCVWDLFPDAVGTEVYRKCQRAMTERVSLYFEAYYPASGKWYENHLYPTKEGLSVYWRDITERKAAEEQRAYHAHLLEHIQDGVIATDEQFAVTAWNRGAERMYGWSADEVVGRNVWDIVPSDLTDQEVADGRRELAETGRRHFEVTARHKDGARLFIECSVIALRGPQGEITGYLGINRDMTERKRREKELQRSQAYLAEGQRLTKTGSWSWKIATGEIFWSEQQFRLYGWDPRGAPPSLEGCLGLIHPDDRAFIEQKLADTLTDIRDYEWDCRVVAVDGTVKHVHTTAHPVLENGALVEYVGATMDVTDRVRGEDALLRTQDALARVTREMIMGELMASVAHELNQPLAAVVAHGNAGMRWLAREAADIGEARHAFERIVRDATRAGEVLRRIRSLVMGTEPVSAPVEIGPLVSEALMLLQDEARARDVTVRELIERDLPSVQGDAVQLQQAVFNLAQNGIEAMSGGNGRPRVLRVDVKRTASDAILVAVRDSGSGFDADLATTIFEPFYTTKPGGLGMGLAISRTIVEAHGGALWATTDPAGTTFQFTLPVRQDAAA
jgi:PAS domain S-box-containing protein